MPDPESVTEMLATIVTAGESLPLRARPSPLQVDEMYPDLSDRFLSKRDDFTGQDISNDTSTDMWPPILVKFKALDSKICST